MSETVCDRKGDATERQECHGGGDARQVSRSLLASAGTEQNCRIASSFEQVAALQEKWDAMALETGADVYSTYDWARIWWRHYGEERELKIHVFQKNGDVCAIVPIFVEALGWGPIEMRVARLAGCDHSVTTCGLVARAEDLKWIVSSLAKTCIDAGCDAMEFGPLAGDDHIVGALNKAVAETEFRRSRLSDRHPHMLFNVAPTYDEFLEALSAKERRNVRRDERRLREQGVVQIEANVRHGSVAGQMERFVEMHQAQWIREGQLGHFGDWPRAREFHNELAECMSRRGRLLLTKVQAGSRVVAMEYSYHWGNSVHWVLGARLPGITGRTGFCALMQQCQERKVRRIDALRGYYEYKRLLGAQVTQQRVVTAMRPEWLRGLRAKGLGGASRVLDLLYYRLWFSRLRRRLGVAGHPLRRCWIRWGGWGTRPRGRWASNATPTAESAVG